MFRIAVRDAGARQSPVVSRASMARHPAARRGPVAHDAAELRSASRWFVRQRSVYEPSCIDPATHATGVVVRVAAPTGLDWRHAAIQLR